MPESLIQGPRRDVVIMADRDPPKQRPDGSIWLPGQEGAARLSRAIRPFVRTVKIIKPPFHKDARARHRAGAADKCTCTPRVSGCAPAATELSHTKLPSHEVLTSSRTQ